MAPCILECGISRRSRVTGNKLIDAFYWLAKSWVVAIKLLLATRMIRCAARWMPVVPVLVPFRWERNE